MGTEYELKVYEWEPTSHGIEWTRTTNCVAVNLGYGTMWIILHSPNTSDKVGKLHIEQQVWVRQVLRSDGELCWSSEWQPGKCQCVTHTNLQVKISKKTKAQVLMYWLFHLFFLNSSNIHQACPVIESCQLLSSWWTLCVSEMYYFLVGVSKFHGKFLKVVAYAFVWWHNMETWKPQWMHPDNAKPVSSSLLCW